MSDDDTTPTTRLLTLLNVSATRSTKRKREYEDLSPSLKLNKRRSQARKTVTTSEVQELKENGEASIPVEDVHKSNDKADEGRDEIEDDPESEGMPAPGPILSLLIETYDSFSGYL